jgi:hypothetical protein
MIYLKCLNSGSYHLTPGRIYEAKICDDCPSEFQKDKMVFDYYIINDKGVKHGVEKSLFINITDLRNDKLNELGI